VVAGAVEVAGIRAPTTSPVIAHDIAQGSVAAYPETNSLVPRDYQDLESGTPSYKSVPVQVRRAA
jgi:hypothetical protein